jgi:eukaryotic-like serine/threonine-protein kinase
MAVVWRALHHGPGRFRRTVAVKQMHAHLASQQMYRDLFREEARVGCVLQDPNIAQVFDFVHEDGHDYLVMEWVDGVDLSTYIHYVVDVRKERPRWEQVAAVGVGVLRGLAAAHERTLGEEGEEGADGAEPIVHRDVSPHNVLIGDRGRAKLIDFGLSYARDRDIEDTDPGVAKGKLAYLAPEIVRGDRPTPLTDQFAVGSLLFEALVGRRAFDGVNDYETYTKLANAEVESLGKLRRDIPKDLRVLIHRALALDPAKRYASAREMALHLGEVLKTHRTSEDLYDMIAGTVRAARTDLGIGRRTQDPETESPISDHSGMVELLVEQGDKPAGFRKWIPSFLRNLTE